MNFPLGNSNCLRDKFRLRFRFLLSLARSTLSKSLHIIFRRQMGRYFGPSLGLSLDLVKTNLTFFHMVESLCLVWLFSQPLSHFEFCCVTVFTIFTRL